MSLGEADGKFPTANQGTGLPPSPTIENPGQVFPKSDPLAAPITPSQTGSDHYIGNPYLMHGALQNVDRAFGEVITILESEERSHGDPRQGNNLLEKIKEWRDELHIMRGGTRTPPARTPLSQSPEDRGGIFVD